MTDCKVDDFPFPKGLKFHKDTGDKFSDPEMYRRIIGKLLYLNMTRPDISYAVQQLSQFFGDPRLPHFSAAQHVLKYLKGTLQHGLFYSDNTNLKLQAYCDEDWGTCAYSARSLTIVSFWDIP
ncbi:uncharacterized protein LOC110706515 [Chenopodium quinoa]|uniref:Reverse transcriptase n=1 Tax=Chenopodium quinoa TaxID=63459 RepID=A0A803ME85_CHEQI|nr:uncharacterized protein LOC110706515 [Chenopodium quinoa]